MEWEETQIDRRALRAQLVKALDDVSPATRDVIYDYLEKGLESE